MSTMGTMRKMETKEQQPTGPSGGGSQNSGQKDAEGARAMRQRLLRMWWEGGSDIRAAIQVRDVKIGYDTLDRPLGYPAAKTTAFSLLALNLEHGTKRRRARAVSEAAALLRGLAGEAFRED